MQADNRRAFLRRAATTALALGLSVAIFSAVGMVPVAAAVSPPPSPTPYSVVATPVHRDVSPQLASLQPANYDFASSARGGKERGHKPLPKRGNGPASGGSASPSVPSASAPTPGINFDGVGQGLGSYVVCCAPPDPNASVGPNHIVETVNLDLAIFNKSGTLLYGPVSINTLWQGFGGGCQTDNDGDPSVVYDSMADRWLISQFAVTTTKYLNCVAVSQTPDPTGAYNRYSYMYSDFPDYPKFGVWPDAYYVTFNMFAGGRTFSGGTTCAYDRAKMLAGASATQQCFNVGVNWGGLLPSTLDGATAPPSGSPNFVLALDTSSTLAYWKFHTDWATPANTTMTGPAFLSVPAFTSSCSNVSRGACIPQAGTSQKLESLADRLMYRFAYRNFGDHEALVVNHTIEIGSGSSLHSGVRWYEIRPDVSRNLSVFQQGTYAPDNNWRWMASAAMDRAGNIALGYSVSGSVHPQIHYTARLASDPAGTMSQGENVIIDGGGSQTSIARWGDYTSMAVDPSDGCTFWYTNEYLKANGSFNWSTRIASFKLPGCVEPDWSALYSVGNTPTTWTSNQTQAYNVSVTNNGAQNWPAGGINPVHLGVHFSNWVTDQRFSLPNDLAPGASVTLTISVTAPGNSGNLVLEYQMVKEAQFWFSQVADVNVMVTGNSWTASYNVANTPTSWTTNQTQTYNVTLTNAGTQTWPAGGSNPVHLGVHFSNWVTDQRFGLPNDLAPGASVMLTIAVTAPSKTGNLVLEYQMVKESQFWFGQVADANVTVTGNSWTASYNVANTPTGWTPNQPQAYVVTLTNAGTQTWPAGGSNPVHLGVHFVSGTGWLTDQRFTLPNDVAAGAGVTLTIAVTGPSINGNLVLEYQMVKESQFWFGQVADVNVTVTGNSWTASYNASSTPISWTTNQTQTYNVTLTNSGTQGWPASGNNPVHLGVHFVSGGIWLTDQRFSLPSDLAPGASITLTIAVTAPSTAANMLVELQMVKEGQFWFGQVADVNVTVT